MPFIEDFAQQAAQEALGAGLGIILGGINDRRQLRQQEKLQGLQIMGQKQLTDYQMKKQLEMWDKTNFSAQVAQLHKAGLNPALLYGKGGAGGATSSVTPGSLTGAHAPVGGGEAMGMGMSMAQMGLLRAQRENIEADTKLKLTDAAKKSGVDTTLGQTQILDLLQGIENKKAQEKLTQVQTDITNIEKEVKGKTITEQQDIIIRQASKAVEEIDILHQQLLLDRQTRDMKVELLRNQIANEIVKTSVLNTGIQVSQAEIQKWTQEISQGWKHIDIQQKQLIINALETDIKQKYPGLWNVIGRMLNDAGNKIGEIFGEKPPTSASDKIKQ